MTHELIYVKQCLNIPVIQLLAPYVIFQKLRAQRSQRLPNGANLRNDINAITLFFYHAANAAQLTLNASQAVGNVFLQYLFWVAHASILYTLMGYVNPTVHFINQTMRQMKLFPETQIRQLTSTSLSASRY